jgi:hypothetical protein
MINTKDNISNYKGIPAMTPPIVHEFLYELGLWWSGKGIVVELGGWLGATTRALLDGLGKKYNLPYYCYDRWQANQPETLKAKLQGVDILPEQNLLPLFLQNVNYENIQALKGDISTNIKNYHGDDIEICLFDAPKREPIFSDCMNILLPHFIPGVTILGLLDYYFYRRQENTCKCKNFLAPVKFIEAHNENFEKIAEWPNECSCVFFKYIKEI